MLPFGIRWDYPPVYGETPPPSSPPPDVITVASDKCEATTKNGSPCRNHKMKNGSYCNIHHQSYNKSNKERGLGDSNDGP